MPARNANHWTHKPPVGTTLDPAHPVGPGRGLVACWPFWEGTGTKVTDLVSGQVLAVSGTAIPWLPGPAGVELQSASVAGQYRVLSSPVTALPVTIGMVGRSTIGNNGSVRDCFGVYDSAGNSVWGVGWAGTTGIPCAMYGNSVSNAQGTALGAGTPAVVVGTFPDSSSKATLFVNGVQKSQTASNVTTFTPGSVRALFGIASSPFAAISFGVLWNRTLSAAEIAAWSADPYGLFLTPPAPRRWFSAGGAVVVTPHNLTLLGCGS